LAENKLLEG